MKQMVWDEKTGTMVEAKAVKVSKSVAKVSVDSKQAEILKGFAKKDNFDLTGISYVTEKDTAGKTKMKDGQPVFKMANGKKVTVAVEESTGKVNAAIGAYVAIAIDMLIAHRAEAEAKTTAETTEG